MNRRKVQVVVAIVVLVFAGGIILSGGAVESTWLRFFGVAVFVVVGALAIWEKFIWRLPPIQRLKGAPTDISGTWEGTLTSLWVGPGGVTPGPKTVYLVIRQTASTVSVVLLTDESRSHSSLAAVTADVHGNRLDYLFLNSPAAHHEEKSRMHRGATTLDICGRPATGLEGRYWTDRETRGDFVFANRHRTHAGNFDSARSLFG